MSKFHPSAQPCQNCRKKKTAHKRVLGVLLCPKMLNKKPESATLLEVTYLTMGEPRFIMQNVVMNNDGTISRTQENIECL